MELTTLEVLMKHFPIEIRCIHATGVGTTNYVSGTDQCICSCGDWPAPIKPSIGEAILAWAEHVASFLYSPQSDQAKLDRHFAELGYHKTLTITSSGSMLSCYGNRLRPFRRPVDFIFAPSGELLETLQWFRGRWMLRGSGVTLKQWKRPTR